MKFRQILTLVIGITLIACLSHARSRYRAGPISDAVWAKDADVDAKILVATQTVFATVQAEGYLNSNGTIRLPYHANANVVVTNNMNYISFAIGPFEYDVDFTYTWGKTSVGTSIFHFAECATNVVFDTAWVTNVSLYCGTNSAKTNVAWTLNAGNMAYGFPSPAATSGNGTNNIAIKATGSYLYTLP